MLIAISEYTVKLITSDIFSLSAENTASDLIASH